MNNKELNIIFFSNVRKEQKKQGYFDGRFVEKVEKSKKKYNRKKLPQIKINEYK